MPQPERSTNGRSAEAPALAVPGGGRAGPACNSRGDPDKIPCVDAPARAEFERVFRACHPAVYRYAARRVAPDAVQDVVSETFLVAWRRFGDLYGEPLPW